MAILLKNKAPYILSCALLSSAVLLSTGCSSDEESQSAEQSGAVSSLLDKTTAAATSAIDSAKTAVEETASSATSVVEGAVDSATSVAEGAVDSATSVAEGVVDSVTSVAEGTVDSATSAVEETAETAVVEKTVAAKDVVTSATVAVTEATADKKVEVPTIDNGAELYANCSGCHGVNGSGGVGPALNNQAFDEVVSKLQRYKAGEQIGPMSGMMQPIAKALSEAEINAVAKYATSLK